MFSKYIRVAVSAALLSLAAQVHAVDGIVLIDQNRALAGNLTAGDTPGYPVSINLPGSYRLSGNLTVPSGLNGIEIAADDVTLDLNGFRVTSSGGSATGVRDMGSHARIAVSNGTISGFGTGVLMMTSKHVHAQDLRTTNLSGVSMVVGPYSLLQHNSAQGLLQVECPSVISENVTEGFITVVVGTSGELCVRWHNRSLNFTGDVTQ